MMKDWEIVHEMDNEDGTPTCYARKFGNQQWWLTQHPDRWVAETKVKIDREPEIVSVKDFKTAKAGIRWVENNHQDWTQRAWE